MAYFEKFAAGPFVRPAFAPWVLVATGVALAGVAVVVPALPDSWLMLFRLVLVGVALLAASGGVWARLQTAGQEASERATSSAVLALAALVPLAGYAVLEPEWDSVRFALAVLTVIALSGALLVLLPSLMRRVVLSLVVLVHFGGILTSTTSVPPPGGGEAPWLNQMAWSRFYRPYLQFLYLTNAYHFYSPDPGPPTLLWFHVDYADGSERWVRLPERDQFPTRLQYHRRLALTESTNQLMPPLSPFPQQLVANRLNAGSLHVPPIPPHPQLSENFQFRPALPYSLKMVAFYARHVAHTYRSDEDPDAEVEGIKVYRVVRAIMSPGQMVVGIRPTTPTLQEPFYQGEFDKDGKLKDPHDPFLYWLIPIMQTPLDDADQAPQVFNVPRPHEQHEFKTVDFTKFHAEKRTRKPAAQ